MLLDDVVYDLKKRIKATESNVFEKPPTNWEEFVRQRGIWTGLNDAVRLIEDAMRKANQDENYT